MLLFKLQMAVLDSTKAKQDSLICVLVCNFFGTRHGKSVCDGEIGMIKRCSSLAIKLGNAVISCAEDLLRILQDAEG